MFGKGSAGHILADAFWPLGIDHRSPRPKKRSGVRRLKRSPKARRDTFTDALLRAPMKGWAADKSGLQTTVTARRARRRAAATGRVLIGVYPPAICAAAGCDRHVDEKRRFRADLCCRCWHAVPPSVRRDVLRGSKEAREAAVRAARRGP